MVDDQKTVEQDATSEGEALVPETQPEPEPEPEKAQEPQLTEDRVQQMIAESNQKAMEQGKELGRREMQSIKDAEVTKVQRQSYSNEKRLQAVLAETRQSDPEAYEKMQNTNLREKVSFYEQEERETMQRQNALQVIKDFEEDMGDLIESFGLKAKDPRIDWGDKESMNLSQRLKAIKESTKKAYKEDTDAKKAQTEKASVEQSKRKEREESGVDKHDIAIAGGSTASIPTDINTFRSWVADLPQTKYAELRPKIEKMLAEGKIK